MKRIFDIVLALFLFFVFLIPMVGIALGIKLTSKGDVIFWSNRIGINGVVFSMPKFRSMVLGTPNVATHLLEDVNNSLTALGRVLRKYSLDELPQLWSIIKGDMSFVGPRPALYNQDDLIQLRKKYSVDSVLPGLTGWAQVNGRDGLTIEEKVKMDAEYLNRKSFLFDMRILWLTFVKILNTDDISH